MPEMTAANWITLLLAVIGAAVTWGSVSSQVGHLKETLGELKAQIAELKASRERTGERLGKLETSIQVERVRHDTGVHGHRLVPRRKPPTDDEEVEDT